VSNRQTGSSGWHLENNYIDIISESTGTTLTISSDHIQNARGGLAHIVGQHAEDFTGGVNRTTTSLAMDYAGTTVAESFGVGIVQNVGKLGKVSYLYVPNHTAQGAQTTKDSVLQAAGVVADDGDAVLGSDDLPNAYEFGFIGDLGVKGLTVKAFKNVEGIKKAANNTSSALSKTKGQTVGVRYNYDIFTVGVNQMKQKVGQTSGITTTTTPSDGAETKQMEYGLGFAVNKDLSVGLYLNRAKRTGDTNNIGNETEKTQSIAVGYSLGPVALSTQYGRVNNMNGIADKDANVLFMSLTTAF
jgi:lipopolysaccharide assembly outer membrane protein LptD (OstA)